MNKKIIVSIVIILIILAGIGVYFLLTTQKVASTTAPSLEYHDTQFGFGMTIPAGYRIDTKDTYYASKDSKIERICITSSKSGEKLGCVYLNGYEGDMGDDMKETKSTIEIHGVAARKTLTQFGTSGTQTITISFWRGSDSYVINLAYTTPEEQKVADEIISSFTTVTPRLSPESPSPKPEKQALYLTHSASSNPSRAFLTISLDTQKNDADSIVPLDMTGWTIESTVSGKAYTIGKVTKEAFGGKGDTSSYSAIPPMGAVLSNMDTNIVLVSGAPFSESNTVDHGLQTTYTLYAGSDFPNLDHDYVQVVDKEGNIIASYNY
jgi:hypothetical protein